NSSLRFGFDWDKQYFIGIEMSQQKYLPFIGGLTIHPLLLYLMFCDRRNMLSEILIGNVFFYLCLVLDEWIFSFALRLYPLSPYAAFYCEGPLCMSRLETQYLMVIIRFVLALLCFSMMIVNSPFDFLVVRMQQMFVPPGSRAKIPKRIQIMMGAVHTSLIASNVIAWGVFGRECDDRESLIMDPELSWLIERGGRILMFGAPGTPQHFG
ncbi:hypothetical protein PMAYCL1PPCAC_32070, partial [Pristionchus mayeri]